jgi:hypothetical protein
MLEISDNANKLLKYAFLKIQVFSSALSVTHNLKKTPDNAITHYLNVTPSKIRLKQLYQWVHFSTLQRTKKHT